MKKAKLKDLIPDDANFNLGTEFGNSLIDKSLTKFGAGRSILIDKNNRIIAGNKTIENAAANGFDDVIVVETIGNQIVAVKRTDVDLNTKKGREMALADNATAKANISWDSATLTEWDMPVQEWGIELPEIIKEGDADAEPQIDKAAELNKKWKVKSGDLWLIGEHRLLCGDSTIKSDVTRLMGQEKAILMNTDPPYGIAYVQNAKSKDQAEAFEDIANDDLDGEMLQEFLENAIRAALDNLEPNAAFYLWHPMLTQGTFFAAAAAAAADILIHRQIIWIKPSMVFGRGDYHWQHELAFYGWVRGNRPPFYGERNQTTYWAMGRENDNIHPTQKPIELFLRPINNHTKPGELIYEPFAGSGSQLVAAENTNRRCYAMELNPDYVACVLERMQTAFPELEIKRGETAKSIVAKSNT